MSKKTKTLGRGPGWRGRAPCHGPSGGVPPFQIFILKMKRSGDKCVSRFSFVSHFVRE